MQHYGVPTRLLDWTEGAMIALYFAVRSNKGDQDAAVWVLDPWWLNAVVIGREVVFETRNQEVSDYLAKAFSDRRLPSLPVAVAPPHVFRRMSAQQSAFTIHGSQPDGLSDVHGDGDRRLVKIAIPGPAITDIRKDLGTAGIVETTVFPDLEGLGKELRANWTKEPLEGPTR
jgi:hypothetical protein